MRHQNFIDLAHGTSLGGSGVEFAIRKGSSPPLSKTIVRILDDPTLPQDWGEIKTTGGRILAPFEDERT